MRAYVDSPSAYGTFDQAANVWEWNEATFLEDEELRGLRGSARNDPRAESMSADFRGRNHAVLPSTVFGFRLASLVPPSCDFDDNFVCDVADLDLLMQAFGTSNERFNLDASNDVIDEGDRDAWLIDVGTSLFGEPFKLGDTNLDGIINVTDLNVLGVNWLADDAAGWSGGGFNGDRRVDSQDLNPVGVNWQSDIRPAMATVPEPQLSWFVIAILLLTARSLRVLRPGNVGYREWTSQLSLVTLDGSRGRGAVRRRAERNGDGGRHAWKLNGLADRLDGPSARSVLGETEMSAILVVVAPHEGTEDPPQVPLTQDDDVVETLAAEGPDHSLDVGILPRRPGSAQHFLSTKSLDPTPAERAVGARQPRPAA